MTTAIACMSAEAIFRKAVQGPNVMTPDVIRYEKVAENVAVELSEGRWVWEPVFGITVVSAEEKDGRIVYTRRDDLNQVCYSRQEAEEYIAKLRQKESLT